MPGALAPDPLAPSRRFPAFGKTHPIPSRVPVPRAPSFFMVTAALVSHSTHGFLHKISSPSRSRDVPRNLPFFPFVPSSLMFFLAAPLQKELVTTTVLIARRCNLVRYAQRSRRILFPHDTILIILVLSIITSEREGGGGILARKSNLFLSAARITKQAPSDSNDYTREISKSLHLQISAFLFLPRENNAKT